MNDIIIIKKLKMGKIGHSSALCGRELALRELAHFLTRPVTIATPVNKSTPDGRSGDSLNRRHFDLGGTLRPTSLAMGLQTLHVCA